MSRPEHQAPPEIFYGDDEAGKYTSNTRVQNIQSAMTHRAMELLDLPDWKAKSGALLLDIGCGSGLSGEIITEYGHQWVGFDISPSMLEVALDRDVEGDVMLADGGQGVPYRAGTFDGAISISVLQWLCNADNSSHSPRARLSRFFTSLHAALCRGARAVFQFYPENDDQIKMISDAALDAGFGGGVTVDFPNSTKARKFYLVLATGGSMLRPAGLENVGLDDSASNEGMQVPAGVDGAGDDDDDGDDRTARMYGDRVKYVNKRDREITEKRKGSKRKKQKQKEDQFGMAKGSKEWVMRKKELYRKRGKEDVPTDSKFTGRKRRPQF